jgi:hypothetical protein
VILAAVTAGCGPTQAEKDLAARMGAAVSKSEAAANRAEAAAKTAADAVQRADAAAQKAELAVSKPCQQTTGGPCNTVDYGYCCPGTNCVCKNQRCRKLFPGAKTKP